MEHYRLNNLDITLEREGAKRFTKASYPIRYNQKNSLTSSFNTFPMVFRGSFSTKAISFGHFQL